MASEGCLKITLIIFGFIFSAVTLYIVFLLPETPKDGPGDKKQSAVERLFRSRREVDDHFLRVLIARKSVNTLTSPNYPDNYPSNAEYQWLLTTLEANATISIKIDTLRIEPETECRLDYLQVFLGNNARAPSLGPFCGNINSRLIETNSSTLLLSFHSDLVYEDKGFAIDYFIPSERGCQELLTDASNTLTSPGFPVNYPDGTDCSTLISVSEEKKIILNFDSVDMEYGDNCTFDYVQVFDGENRNSTLLGQICQQSDPMTFESSSNSLLVHFHSDDNFNKQGYRARYTSVDKRSSPIGNCQWESGEDNGIVSSPNYPENYPSYANCIIWILAPEGNRISIVFDNLLLEIETNCSYDFLQISEGPSSDNKILGRFCGRGSEPKFLLSDGHEVKIEFRSDNFVEFLGFNLQYEFQKIEAEPEGKKGILDENFDSQESLFTFSVKPENATLSAGSSHMLKCNTDHPNAKIRWLKGDVFLAGDSSIPGLKLLVNNTLWIKSMHENLAGQYTCVGVSPEEDIVATAYITMNGSSENESCGIELRKTPNDAEYEEGKFAHLECLAAVPEVQLTWEKDGWPLEQQKYVTVLKNGYIFMNRVRLEDAGTYTCVARDTVKGCFQRFSAKLKVNERIKIEDICGKPRIAEPVKEKSAKHHAKIIGGKDAQKGAYPWQVMLWDPMHKQVFCGGTLLNERWIATAAHCIKNKHNIPWNRIMIKLGKHDQTVEEDQEIITSIADISAIVIHPDFKSTTYDNDIALIRLKHHIYFTDYVLPICLGDRNLSETLLNGDGDHSKPKMGTVIGWGKLKYKGAVPRFLQEITLPIVEDEVCKNSTSLSVTRNMFCAGYSQEIIGDSCSGDSGGPFLMKDENKWYMVGIVSWGEECGKINKYGFYTRIPNHLSWIQGIIKR